VLNHMAATGRAHWMLTFAHFEGLSFVLGLSVAFLSSFVFFPKKMTKPAILQVTATTTSQLHTSEVSSENPAVTATQPSENDAGLGKDF